MKLLFCQKCQDVVALSETKLRTCECGACGGLYDKDPHAIYFGDYALPFAVDNNTFFHRFLHHDSEEEQERPANMSGLWVDGKGQIVCWALLPGNLNHNQIKKVTRTYAEKISYQLP